VPLRGIGHDFNLSLLGTAPNEAWLLKQFPQKLKNWIGLSAEIDQDND
jgi:hypothetical protein